MGETTNLEAPLAACTLPCAAPCEQTAEEGLLAQSPAQAFGIESDDGASSLSAAEDPRPRQNLGAQRFRPWATAFAGLGVTLLLVCAAVGAWGWRRQGLKAGDVDENVELGSFDNMASVLGHFADVVHQSDAMVSSTQKAFTSVSNVANTFNHSSEEFGGLGAKILRDLRKGPAARKAMIAKFKALNKTRKEEIKQKLFARFNITSLKQLRPLVHMHDGSRCQNDEEEFNSLCYKKCALLTNHSFPFRVSAWECCQHPGICGTAYKIDFGLCGGFGVSGDQVGNGCPHTLGGCLKDEELYGNLCYKRCQLLTYGILTQRTGPMTCCKTSTSANFLAFLDFQDCNTESDYYKGGGWGDNDTSTSAQPHLPMTSLTES